MNPYGLLRDLLARGATLRVEDGRLICRPPAGGLSARETAFLREQRDELITLLSTPAVPTTSLEVPMPADAMERLPTLGQERLWALSKLEDVAGAYNQGIALCFAGELSNEALEYALSRILQRHETLRSRYPAVHGIVTVQIDPPAPVSIELEDLTIHGKSAVQQAHAHAAEALEAPYDLEKGSLFRYRLYRLASHEHLLVIGVHHIVSDAWSWSILTRELVAFYRERVTGEPATVSALSVSYFDEARWHRSRLERDLHILENDLKYWKKQLAGAPALDLPTSFSRPALQSYRGDAYSFDLPAPLRRSLEQICRQEGATLFMAMLGLFQLLLARYSGQNDIVVGIPESGRTHAATEGLIGFFINTLAIRSSFSDELTFRGLLKQVRSNVLGAIDHRALPFDRIVHEVEVERDPSRSPVFQAMFSFPSVEAPKLDFPGLEVSEWELQRRSSMFDLTLWVGEKGQNLRCELEYRTDLFERRFVEKCAEQFVVLVEGAIATPDVPVMHFPLLTANDRRMMIEASAGPQDPALISGTFLEWMRQRVQDDGGRVAVEDEYDRCWTYSELWDYAGRVVTGLRAHGVSRGDLVGIRLERGAPVVGIALGILRSGAAYLPLDPNFPDERLEYMLEDAAAVLVVSDQPAAETGTVKTVTPEMLVSGGAVDSGLIEAHSDDLAYVIYTSGSTGKPKGVEIAHGALRNFLGSMQSEPGLAPDDTLLAVTTLSFDISGLELFLPLCTGARVVIPSYDTVADGSELADRLAASHATVMQATPATWRMLLDAGWRGRLGKVFCGGEALGEELAQELLNCADEVWNLYGPTETTIWSTAERIEQDRAVVVGRPIANTRVYVLDSDGGLVPDGVRGEIWIAGAGVARGYRKRPELTAERFRIDPFMTNERMYRTGDLGRWRLDGRLEHLGRLDFQVKVHGYRIELGEIEAALNAFVEVRQAVVMARGEGENKRLVAYVIFEASRELLAGEVRRRLANTLPQYMVPGLVVATDSFPLTPNGKVDRNALPNPIEEARPEIQYEPPKGEFERHLADIWCDLLSIPQVGRHDNFFELGGHSLLVLRAVAEIKYRTGSDVDPRAFFFRTLSQIAAAAGASVPA